MKKLFVMAAMSISATRPSTCPSLPGLPSRTGRPSASARKYCPLRSGISARRAYSTSPRRAEAASIFVTPSTSKSRNCPFMTDARRTVSGSMSAPRRRNRCPRRHRSAGLSAHGSTLMPPRQPCVLITRPHSRYGIRVASAMFGMLSFR